MALTPLTCVDGPDVAEEGRAFDEKLEVEVDRRVVAGPAGAGEVPRAGGDTADMPSPAADGVVGKAVDGNVPDAERVCTPCFPITTLKLPAVLGAAVEVDPVTAGSPEEVDVCGGIVDPAGVDADREDRAPVPVAPEDPEDDVLCDDGSDGVAQATPSHWVITAVPIPRATAIQATRPMYFAPLIFEGPPI